jgi:hypothetical protein
MHSISSRTIEPETPAKIAPESKTPPSKLEVEVTPVPGTVVKEGTRQPYPPRTPSARAVAGSIGYAGPEAPSKVAMSLQQNVTFNDIMPLDSYKEQATRLPGSRSNHILGSFRNIFKSRSDSWNKSSRNPKAAADESSTTPTPSLPRFLAPPSRFPGGDIPSFPRPTKLARAKTTPGPKGQASITPDIHSRLGHVQITSTGSPHRLSGSPRRPADGQLRLSTQRKITQSPVSASDKTVATSDSSIDSVPKNLSPIRACMETLCKKAGEATTTLERDRYIRVRVFDFFLLYTSEHSGRLTIVSS